MPTYVVVKYYSGAAVYNRRTGMLCSPVFYPENGESTQAVYERVYDMLMVAAVCAMMFDTIMAL